MMTTRYCPTCAAEVEDAGGFCMLGHRLAPERSPLDDLRSEIDRKFEAVRAEVSSLGTRPAAPRPPSGSPAPPPPPPPAPTPRRQPTVWDGLEDEPLAAGDPIASFAPPPRMDWGPERSVLNRLDGLFTHRPRASRASA